MGNLKARRKLLWFARGGAIICCLFLANLASAITLPHNPTGPSHFDLNAGTNRNRPFFTEDPFRPALPRPTFCVTQGNRGACDFDDFMNSGSWHWQTSIKNEHTQNTLLGLRVAFILDGVIIHAGQLSLGIKSEAVLDIVVDEPADIASWTWEVILRPRVLPPASRLSLDSAIWEAPTHDPKSTSISFFSDPNVDQWETQADTSGTFDVTFSLTRVPEPTSLLLFGSGLCGIIWHWRRRRLERGMVVADTEPL